MNEPRYRDEFDRLTAFGVRRLVQANMFDDEKSLRAVKWLKERGQLQDHQEEKQENAAIARERASTERGTDLEQSQAGPAGVPSSAAQGWRSLLKWEDANARRPSRWRVASVDERAHATSVLPSMPIFL
jgi:hypothetical protein